MPTLFRSAGRMSRFRSAPAKAAPAARASAPCVAEPLEERRLMTVPAGFTETKVGGNLSYPTAMEFSPDGRLFISEEAGKLRVVTPGGSLLSTPFATVPSIVGGERGLLGIAFDPDYSANRYVYVYWTTSSGGAHNVISRFTADANNPNVSTGSRTDLYHLPALNSQFHNGGTIHFGEDGKLYVAVGDNANSSNPQNMGSQFGKILRLNKDGSIPTDNPFYNSASGNNRSIYALGFRNPFNFSIQPGTGKLYVNDVGQDTYEEINVVVPKGNYGWPLTEGPTSNPAFIGPIHSYKHADIGGEGSAITGGAFYYPRAGANSLGAQYEKDYFFTDLSSHYIKHLDPAQNNKVEIFATDIFRPVDLKVAPDGALYYLSIGVGTNDGKVVRIARTGSAKPAIGDHPASASVAVGEPATFSVTASGSGLSYQWQRNGQNIANAKSSSYTIAAAAASDDGAQFRVVVTNAGGSVTSNAATLSVNANAAPAPVIDSPSAGTTFAYGQTFDFAGSATDAEDGVLPGTSLAWRVDYYTGGEARPFVPNTVGAAGSFTLPTETPYSDVNVFYRVFLTATDSAGRSKTVTRDIQPRKANITLAANVAGLKLLLDGQPVTAPTTRSSVVGFARTIGVTSPQTLNGVTYDFAGWSDGGAQSHGISSPAANTTYTATFTARPVTGPVATQGLKATYWNNSDFTGTSVSRTDANINFDWGMGSPAAAIQPDSFSARWTGKISIPTTGTYTFSSYSNNGFRLWVNGKQIINKWDKSFYGNASGTISLTGGKKYDIKVEYFDYNMTAFAKLSWAGPGIAKQIVPSSRLTTA